MNMRIELDYQVGCLVLGSNSHLFFSVLFAQLSEIELRQFPLNSNNTIAFVAVTLVFV